MANRDDLIQRSPLLPPNSPTITEADRARVYAIIGRELDNFLNGPSSYHSDGTKKSSFALMTELKDFVGSVSRLREIVGDPANILGEIGSNLDAFKEAFGGATSNDVETMWNNPQDARDRAIKLPDSIAPTTNDQNVIYVDPEPDPWYPAPNPVIPKSSREVRGSANPLGAFEASQARFDQTAQSCFPAARDSRAGSEMHLPKDATSGIAPALEGASRWGVTLAMFVS